MKELSFDAVGLRIRRCREDIGLTREQFAEQVKISPQFLAEIENGKKGVSAETLFKICTRFHLSSDYILLGSASGSHFSDPISELLQEFSPAALALAEELLRAVYKSDLQKS